MTKDSVFAWCVRVHVNVGLRIYGFVGLWVRVCIPVTFVGAMRAQLVCVLQNRRNDGVDTDVVCEWVLYLVVGDWCLMCWSVARC
jgi:uncharacterized membrane protein